MTEPAVWFPAIRTGTGTDTFTKQLVEGLQRCGVAAEVTWLPPIAEYVPWIVSIPKPPAWANVVHVNTWLHPRFIPPDLPVVATSHLCVHDPVLSPYKSLFQKIYHRYWVSPLEAALLRRAQRVAAVSHYTAHATKEAFGIRNIAVVHNGVVVGGAEGGQVERNVHRPFRLLYVGNWSARKGVDLLPQIMRQLGPQFELWYTSDVRKKNKKIALPDNCYDLGRLDSQRLQDAYASSDALLFPSRLEGLPLAVIEAMAHALPVIATNGSSLSEIVLHDETGFLCLQDDVDEFVAAARDLASNEVVWRDMGTSGRKRVDQRYTVEIMIDKYKELYRSCLVKAA